MLLLFNKVPFTPRFLLNALGLSHTRSNLLLHYSLLLE